MKHPVFTMAKIKLFIVLMMATLFNVGCMKEINRSLTKYEARESYYAGNFARSFRLTEAMAYQGDPKSKYTLGYMYFYGIGAPTNKSLGIAWIKESALNGYGPAILALEKLSHSQIPLMQDNALNEMPTKGQVIISKERLDDDVYPVSQIQPNNKVSDGMAMFEKPFKRELFFDLLANEQGAVTAADKSVSQNEYSVIDAFSLLSFLDNKLHNTESIETLSVPFINSVPTSTDYISLTYS